MSRNFTKAAAKKNESPSAKIYTSINIRGKIKTELEMPTLLNNMNTRTTARFNKKLISAETLLDATIVHLGILIFLMRSPLTTIDVKLCCVVSTKKSLHRLDIDSTSHRH